MTGAQGETRGQYRVVRSLRGSRKPGDVVEVYDQIFATGPPPGTYQLGVEVTLKDGSKIALSLGRLVVDPGGERHLVP